jgi:hypothetical protein
LTSNLFFLIYLISFVFGYLNNGICTNLYLPEEDRLFFQEEGTLSKIPSLKNTIYIDNDSFNRLPGEVVRQTRDFIDREERLRGQYTIASSTNIAQFALHAIYEDGTGTVFEMLPRNCFGVFYLSGNEPVSYSQDKKPSLGVINVQKVGWKERFCSSCKESEGVQWEFCHDCNAPQRVEKRSGGYVSIIQRNQPLMESVEKTVDFLTRYESFFDDLTDVNSRPFSDLSRVAISKKQEIEIFNKQKAEFLHQLLQETLVPEESKESALSRPFSDFKKNIIKEIRMCLEKNDFKLSFLAKALEDRSFQRLITEIMGKKFPTKMIFSEKLLSELLNSKRFNVGCSEQLILFYLKDVDTRRELNRNFLKALHKEKRVKNILLQIHSTKTPCKTCLINCCGHLESGWLNSLFNELMVELKPLIPVSTNIIISYHRCYEDEYNFGIRAANPSDFEI